MAQLASTSPVAAQRVPARLVGLLRGEYRVRSCPLVVPTAVGAGDEQVLALQLFEACDGLSRWHQVTSDWASNEDRWHGDSPYVTSYCPTRPGDVSVCAA
jgi:hypothetical protein